MYIVYSVWCIVYSDTILDQFYQIYPKSVLKVRQYCAKIENQNRAQKLGARFSFKATYKILGVNMKLKCRKSIILGDTN